MTVMGDRLVAAVHEDSGEQGILFDLTKIWATLEHSWLTRVVVQLTAGFLPSDDRDGALSARSTVCF